MSNSPPDPEPAPRAWRRNTTGSARAAAAPWAPSPRRLRLYLVGAGLVTVCGIILAWFLLLRGFPEPFFLTIPVTEYSDPGLPPNAWAEHDSDLLLAHFSTDMGNKHFHSQERHEFLDALKNLQAKKAPAVVVHLRAHALHRDGTVYLLPGNARLDSPEPGVRLEEVVQAVRKSAAPNRLLLLDVMQPMAVFGLGVLDDDVATPLHAALEKELARAGGPLWVLCACGPGETSLVSEDLRASAFAYFVHEGLRGDADGAIPGRAKDRLVSVKELAAYVTRHVPPWARRTRAAGQTPVLLGGDADFDLVSLATARPGPRLPPEEVKYPDWLSAGWKVRDDWWAAGHGYTQPLLTRRQEAALVRAEHRWRAGVAEEQVQKDLRAALARFRDLSRPHEPGPLSPRSLALAERAGAKPDPALDKELEELLARRERAKPEEAEKLKPEIDKVLALFKGKPFEFGRAALRAVRAAARPERLALLDELPPLRLAAEQYVEAAWLRRLATFCKNLEPTEAAKLPAEALPAALRAVEQIEQAGMFDPRVLPWLEKRFADVVTGRRNGFDWLLKGRPAAWPEAAMRLQQAAADCGPLREAAGQLREALDLRDFALTLLPATVPSLLAQAGAAGDALEKDWHDAARALAELEMLLATPDFTKVQAVEDQRLRLLRTCEALWPRFTDANIEPLLKRAARDDDVNSYLDVEAVLASPWPAGANRARLWLEARRLARLLHEKARAADTRYADPAGPAARAEAERRAGLRARLAAGLLPLTGLPQEDLERAQLAPAEAGPARWQTLGDNLRWAWREQLPGRFRDAGGDLPLADRLSRLVPVARLDDAPGEPAAERLRQLDAAYRRWLDAHLRAEVP